MAVMNGLVSPRVIPRGKTQPGEPGGFGDARHRVSTFHFIIIIEQRRGVNAPQKKRDAKHRVSTYYFVVILKSREGERQVNREVTLAMASMPRHCQLYTVNF